MYICIWFERITHLNRKAAFYLEAVLLVFGFVPVMAQKQRISENQDLLWTRYHLTLRFSERWKWATEADNRVFLSTLNRAQIIAHTHLHYSFSSETEASLGMTYSLVNPPDAFDEDPLTIPEIRPFQEFYLRQNFDNSPLKIQHRFRSEERFFRNSDGSQLIDGHNFNWRFRYQIALEYPVDQKFSIKFNDELFINAGKNIVYNVFDTNRIYGALAYHPLKPLVVELGYLHSVQQQRSGSSLLIRDNIRFTIFHQIDLAKK